MNYKARKRLAKLVKDLRGDQSRRYFGRMFLGVGSNTVKEWEECITIPTLENLKKIAKLANYNSFDEFERYLNGDDSVSVNQNDLLWDNIKSYVQTLDADKTHELSSIATRRLAQLASSRNKF